MLTSNYPLKIITLQFFLLYSHPKIPLHSSGPLTRSHQFVSCVSCRNEYLISHKDYQARTNWWNFSESEHFVFNLMWLKRMWHSPNPNVLSLFVSWKFFLTHSSEGLACSFLVTFWTLICDDSGFSVLFFLICSDFSIINIMAWWARWSSGISTMGSIFEAELWHC